jgi:hypothetical protein
MSSREDWLAQRKQYVTASDVAALLGESKYKTRDQLRMEKMGLADEWQGNEQTTNALLLEAESWRLAEHWYGWHCRPNGNVLVKDAVCSRLAATPDAYLDSPWGTAVVQAKWTRSSVQEDVRQVTKAGKPTTAAFAAGPPIGWQLQVQAELACTNLQHGVLLVMHHGQGLKLRPYYIPRHERVIARIRAETLLFWKEIESCQTL